MEYREAINRLYDTKRHAIEPGLARTERLLSAVGNPDESLDSIQIAGTNGKGSTAAMVSSVLAEAGYSVGRYTSPHLEDIRERIHVNGRPITEAAVARFMTEIEDHLDDAGAANRTPTLFETVTAMALWYFAECEVDVAVVEVGIGGAHDATSVLDPAVAAVTAVDVDHTGVLGETVEEIARDKAAITEGVETVVTGASGTALEIVRSVAPHALVVGAGSGADVVATYEGLVDHAEAAIVLAGPAFHVETKSPLLGPAQAVNAGIAAAIAKRGWNVDDAAIERGIRNVHWPGRSEVVSREPMVLLDGAHNPSACTHLAGVLAEFEFDDLHLVFGAMDDKDLAAMAAALPTPTTLYPCKPRTQRAATPSVIERVFSEAGVDAINANRAVEASVDAAMSAAKPSDCVVVTGSLYTVGEARRLWVRQFTPRRFESVATARNALESYHVTPQGVRHMRAKGVHRSVHVRVQPKQAQFLKEELLSLGGECATAGISDDANVIDIVMMATLSEFRRLAAALQDQPYGLPRIGDEIRHALGIGQDDDRGDWPWSTEPVVMGIVNVTPDSFHDGGQFDDTAEAIKHARTMVDDGAAIVDIGGESTRPGGDPISSSEELDRVLPVIEAIADIDALVSIDTRKADVATAALDAGADIINDVSGLSDPAMAPLAADRNVPIVLTHSVSTPVDPSNDVAYDDVVRDVIRDLGNLVQRCERVGVDRSRILVDPGIGFGKTAAENFELLDRLYELTALDCPILVGHSQKSFFDHAQFPPKKRGPPTIAATALAVQRGADVIRVHDVEPNVASVRTAATFSPIR